VKRLKIVTSPVGDAEHRVRRRVLAA